MKRLLSCLIFLIILFPVWAWGATTFNDTTADHKWSTAANWSDGKPDASDAVTVHADVTAIIIDEAAVCASFDTTAATGNVAVSGSGSLTVSGNFTLASGDTWTHTGAIVINGDSTLNTVGIDIKSIASLTINNSADVTLGANLNMAGKALYINGGSSGNRTVFATANYQIDCGVFGDNDTANYNTLTLGSSTINCTNISFQAFTNLTVTATTAAINIAASGTILTYFGTSKEWGGTTTITYTVGATVILMHNNTFGALTIVFNNGGAGQVGGILQVYAGFTVTNTLTLTANDILARPIIYTNQYYEVGQKTITAKAFTITGAMDFKDIKLIDSDLGDGTHIDLSAINSGDLGGNDNVTFATPKNVYLACEANASKQNYHNIHSLADDGTPDGLTVFPLPQDTLIINNNSFTNEGQAFYFHAATRTGNVDASALTKAETLILPSHVYGSLDYTGSGITLASGAYTTSIIDARLRNEASGTLDINVKPTVNHTGGATVQSAGGTIRLVGNAFNGAAYPWTLKIGTLDLNGQTLTMNTFTSTGTYTRTLQDTAGGGKIVLQGLTGTIWDLDSETASVVTISNSPSIDIGDGDNVLSGNVTFEGGGKTYGDFTVKAHTGSFDTIITGSNTFGVFTIEPSVNTYGVQLTTGTDQTVTSLVSNGTAANKIKLASTTSTHAKISDTTGENKITYTTVTAVDAEGGATFKLGAGAAIADNETGWTKSSAGGSLNMLLGVGR